MLTDLITSGFLVVRASVGIRTCCHNFEKDKVKSYLLVRLSWDIALVIFNVIMIGLRRMQLTSFLTKLLVLILVDGYLNLVILSYLSPSYPLSSSRTDIDSDSSSIDDDE